jgi:type IV secretory pathway TraG/TraD family ATPase VirD4
MSGTNHDDGVPAVVILGGIGLSLVGGLWIGMKVVSAVWGPINITFAHFLATMYLFHTSVVYRTHQAIPHPALWRVTALVVAVIVFGAGVVVMALAIHFVQSFGSSSGRLGSRGLDKQSDDPAEWLPYDSRKYRPFLPNEVIRQDQVHPGGVEIPIGERCLDNYGFVLGYARNNPEHPIAISSELSMLLAGEARSGKTMGFVIPWVSQWQGPVITTSTRVEVIRATLLARKRVSDHIYVLTLPGVQIPEGVQAISYDICWFYPEELDSLVESAERRASIFAAVAGDSNQPVWENATKQIFACLLLIGFAWRYAQVEFLGKDVTSAKPSLRHEKPETDHIDILKKFAGLEWTRTKAGVVEVQKFLVENIPNGKGVHAASYVGSVAGTFAGNAGNTEFAQTITGMIAVALGKLNDPQVAAVFSTRWDQPVFDPEGFLAESGTLYLISRSEDSSDLAKFFSLVVNEVAAAARRRASRMGRCDPGLALILDEIANIAPLPNLNTYMSEGGGNGITTVAVVQNLRQLITLYGEGKGKEIISSANVVATFGGSKAREDLEMFSELAGRRSTQVSNYDKFGNVTGRSDSTEAAIDPNRIANMPRGWIYLKLPNSDPILVKTFHWAGSPESIWSAHPFRALKWRQEWGHSLGDGLSVFNFHGTHRSLSWRALHDLTLESNALALHPLQVKTSTATKIVDDVPSRARPSRTPRETERRTTRQRIAESHQSEARAPARAKTDPTQPLEDVHTSQYTRRSRQDDFQQLQITDDNDNPLMSHREVRQLMNEVLDDPDSQ